MSTEHSEQLEALDDISRNLFDTLTASRDENAGYFRQVMQALQQLQLSSTNRPDNRNVEDKFLVTFALPHVAATQRFVGRENELCSIRKGLIDGESARKIIVLHGLGGIGKTQLALYFVRTYKDTFSAIFWLNGNSIETLEQSFVDIATNLVEEYSSLPRLKTALENSDTESIIQHVKKWLSTRLNTRWLLVFDSVDNPKLPDYDASDAINLQRYLPSSDHGSILVTTRSSSLQLGDMIQVRKLVHTEESIEILQSMSGRTEMHAGEHIR